MTRVRHMCNTSMRSPVVTAIACVCCTRERLSDRKYDRFTPSGEAGREVRAPKNTKSFLQSADALLLRLALSCPDYRGTSLIRNNTHP